MNGTCPPAGKENGQQPGKNCCSKLKTPPKSSLRFDRQRPCLVETPLAPVSQKTSDAMPVYVTSPTKGRLGSRSTRAELIALLCEIHKILAEATTQITIRHLFYRLVGSKLLEKTETDYKRLCAHLSNWRKQGVIPWSAFVDSTRWHLRQDAFEGL